MVTALSSRGCSCYIGAQNYTCRRKTNLTKTSWDAVKLFRFAVRTHVLIATKNKPFLARVDDGFASNTPEGDDGQSKGNNDGKDFAKREDRGIDSEILRQSLERMVSSDDSSFSGVELATLIRKKFGRSYDVQLIKKEFMGRNLLALNVMWKYMEQRSFPLTEEEYLLRLDDVANTLKCWGAVSHIRNSLVNLKERPRIGKAVSIFIDMDESGGRSNEWIYK